MAIDRNVTININDISPSANTAYVDAGKENKVYNKAQVNELVEDLREGALGSISPSQSLEELNALEDGNYYAAEAGTYAFGVTVPNGWQYRFNKLDSTWKTLTKLELPKPILIDGFNSTSTTDGATARSVKILMDITKNGGHRDWVLGAYKKGEIVRHKGILWIADVDITSAEPGVHPTWKLYWSFTQPISTLTSHLSTLTINLVNNTITFTGSSTNKLMTNTSVIGIPAQVVDVSASTQYYALVYNSTTKLVRQVAVYGATSNALAVDDYPFAYILNLSSTIQEVFGIKGYTLINASGTTTFPSVGGATVDILYNKTFSKFAGSRTQDEKTWLNKAIIDLEFYNISSNSEVTLYGLGKNYGSSNLTYLGFAYQEVGKSIAFLYADEFSSAFSMTYDINVHSGVKTYYLRVYNSTTTDKTTQNNIIGKVTIDWVSVPDGKRVVESNSNIIANNSNILRSKFVKSDRFNNSNGFVKFALSRGFYEYYSAPQLESYASASGINSMIPKAPYEDCREWALKWDELITNAPAGYTIEKRTLTTDAPTDTNVEGKLPIYAYIFKPGKLKAGDITANNSQTLPRIFINCSIHGFEKTPSFVVYEFLKLMFNNWKSHPFLEYLRYNVELVIIPFANPHGWNVNGGVGTRVNYNKVDMNRNFPALWQKIGSVGDPTYSGTSALSEIETQSIYQFMQSEISSNTILGIDFHNFHGTVQPNVKDYGMLWTVNMGSELGQSCSNVLIKELSRKFKERSALIPQDEDYFVGTTNSWNGGGFAGMAMKNLGAMYGATFEVAQNFRFNANFKGHDSDSITFGVESFVNYLRVFLGNYIEEYNRIK